MIIEINTNPHSFIVFMTVSMGIAYVFFNPNTSFGAMRLLTLLFLIIPVALVGNQLGHSVDILFGGLVGFCTARGLNPLSPVEGIKSKYYAWQLNKKLRAGKAQFDAEQAIFEEANAEAKVKERAEEAKRTREKHESQQQQKRNQNSDHSSRSSSRTESHQEQPKTSLEMAYEFLGISPVMSHADAKKRYRKMISRYHEDKMPDDLTEWEIEEIKKKSKAVNVTWDLICKRRGWKN